MSKSYGRYKTVGICYGSNTEFYRDRRRHERVVNKQQIRNLLANKNINEFDERFAQYKEPKNTWDEPTDGSYKLYSKNEYFDKGWYKNIYRHKNKIKK